MIIDPNESYAVFVGPIFKNEDNCIPISLSLRTAEIFKVENLDYLGDINGKKFILDLSFFNGDNEKIEITQSVDRKNFIISPGVEFILENDQNHLLEGLDIEKEFKFLI